MGSKILGVEDIRGFCERIGEMVEETEVNEVKKKENETGKSGGKLRRSAIGAILVLLIAFGVTFFYTQKGKSCPCFQVCFAQFPILNLGFI